MTMPIQNWHDKKFVQSDIHIPDMLGIPTTRAACDGSVYDEICYQTRYPTKVAQTDWDDKVTWVRSGGKDIGPGYVDIYHLDADGNNTFIKSVEGTTVSGTPIKENQALDSQRLFAKGLGFTIPANATILAAALVWRWFNNSTYNNPTNPGYSIDVTKVSINGRVSASYYGVFIPGTTPFGNSNAGLSVPMSGDFGIAETDTGFINDVLWREDSTGAIVKLTPEFLNSAETIIAFDTHKTAGPGTGNYELSLYEFGLVVKYTFLRPGVNTDKDNLLKISTF